MNSTAMNVTPIKGSSAEFDTVARPLHEEHCATCLCKLGCVARFFGKRFCSPECDRRYYHALNIVAVSRLRPAARPLILELAS